MHIHQHVKPRAAGRACALLTKPQPKPAAANEKAPRKATAQGALEKLTAGILCSGFGEVLLFPPPAHTPSKPVFIFSRNSPGQKS